jgi:alanine dehydrogenase
MTLILGRSDVRQLLDLPTCIEAVEDALRQHAAGGSIPPQVLGARVPGGTFHVKAAGLSSRVLAGAGHAMFAAKVNANFPGNPAARGLPTIQGVLSLFDAEDGRLLALIDTMEITSIRTAAATAVAAKHLARPDAGEMTICGCGEQAANQTRALDSVRSLRRVMAFDAIPERAASFARALSGELSCDVIPVRALDEETAASDIWVTCTTAPQWFLGRAHVRPGAFVAAVGADNPQKQEIEPELLGTNVVIADSIEQCATSGDLHHAIDAGVMRREDVRGELADVVTGRVVGRRSPDEIVVFDSTGTALQDVAAAMRLYERARAAGVGLDVDLADSVTPARSLTTVAS